MKLSIIVPAHNSEKTLEKCLVSIFLSDFKDFEVIVVNDGSKDKTREIAQKFPCGVISLEKNCGIGYARSIGSDKAMFEILVFIDSDVIINKTTLGLLVKYLELNPDITGVTGLLSETHPNPNFFSQYKNLYMNYIFKKCPSDIDFFYGSFHAIRNTGFDIPISHSRKGEDSERGMLLSKKGYKIALNKELEVIHLKRHSFFSFLKNDFLLPFHWARIFIQQEGWHKIIKKRRFSHARIQQILNIPVSFAILLGLFIFPQSALLFFLLFILLNLDFLIFLRKRKGLLFALKAVFVTWLDQIVMGCGIFTGFTVKALKLLKK